MLVCFSVTIYANSDNVLRSKHPYACLIRFSTMDILTLLYLNKVPFKKDKKLSYLLMSIDGVSIQGWVYTGFDKWLIAFFLFCEWMLLPDPSLVIWNRYVLVFLDGTRTCMVATMFLTTFYLLVKNNIFVNAILVLSHFSQNLIHFFLNIS